MAKSNAPCLVWSRPNFYALSVTDDVDVGPQRLSPSEMRLQPSSELNPRSANTTLVKFGG